MKPQLIIKQLLFLALLLHGTLSLTSETLLAQVYTDEEIGFNREKVRGMFLNDGVKEADLHETVTLYRELLVNMYMSKLSGPVTAPSPSQGCGNIDFSNGFEEWCYKFIERDGISQFPNFTDTCSDFSEGVNGRVWSEILVPGANGYSDNQALNFLDHAADLLNLDKFGPSMIRLGNDVGGKWVERIEKKITVTEENSLFGYRYAVVLDEARAGQPIHSIEQQPYFRVSLIYNNTTFTCTEFLAVLPISGGGTEGSGLPGFVGPIENNRGDKSLYYRPTSSNIINLLDYVSLEAEVTEVTLVVEVADCTLGGHYGFAFFEGFCSDINGAILADTGGEGFCTGALITFSSTQDYFGDDLPTWKILQGDSELFTYIGESLPYTFHEAGDYNIEVTIGLAGNDDPNCEISFTREITIEDCPCFCLDCDSFSPTPGERYVISGWVFEEHTATPLSYEDTHLGILFSNQSSPTPGQELKFYPSGAIIDGWQRIMGEFTIPSNTMDIKISLANNGTHGVEAYFDDIRVHPFNGNLKSFVYDQTSQQLMAELDENNYATFYEYDKEGGLIRVKKETERGIYTIQETRSGNSGLSNQEN